MVLRDVVSGQFPPDYILENCFAAFGRILTFVLSGLPTSVETMWCPLRCSLNQTEAIVYFLQHKANLAALPSFSLLAM